MIFVINRSVEHHSFLERILSRDCATDIGKLSRFKLGEKSDMTEVYTDERYVFPYEPVRGFDY